MLLVDKITDTSKRAKIVCTIGPASCDRKTLEKMIASGTDVCRLNFSHHDHDWHIKTASLIREIEKNQDRPIAIMADLQGPKIRILRFKQASVTLVKGDTFSISSAIKDKEGHQQGVGIGYPAIFDECKVDDVLALSDGHILMRIVNKTSASLECIIEAEGILKDRQGVNLVGGGLNAHAITKKDIEDIEVAVNMGADYIAVSFVRSADDIKQTRSLIQKYHGQCSIVAKIERAEVVMDEAILDSVIRASDTVMIARGDLGVEIGDAALMGAQKYIIKRCIELGKPVITATQMLESVISSPRPTRAEVLDVSNAILDGSDAVMLSAETAVGSYPVEAVQCMANIISGAEKSKHFHMINRQVHRSDDVVADAAAYVAGHLDSVAAIVCVTSSGYTARMISRSSLSIPIIALSPNVSTLRKVSMYKGVHGIMMPKQHAIQEIVDYLKHIEIAKIGNQIIVTSGSFVEQGCTSSMKIIEVT